MLEIFKNIKIKVRKLFSTKKNQVVFLKLSYINSTIENIPDNIEEGIIYVIHGSGKLKWINFMCPCGCGQEISLNLMMNYSPRWSIKKETDGTMTVSPSVNIIEGCKSHFFIRNNRIDWCS